jgi:predicted RNase H-like HicB family nuclease
MFHRPMWVIEQVYTLVSAFERIEGASDVHVKELQDQEAA